MDESLYHEFFRVEERHWWFVGRQRIVLDLLASGDPGRNARTLLDVGCGTGAFLKAASERYEVWGTDVSPLAIEYARKRSMTKLHCGTLDDIPFGDKRFDRLTLLDVIEHVEDDVGLLRQAKGLMAPDGKMIVTVPAHPWLWSRHDELNHHKRRYTRAHLANSLRGAGLRIEKISAMNSLLFPAALLERFFAQWKGGTDDPLRLPPEVINRMLGAVFGFERFLLRIMSLPIGLSFLAVASRSRD